MARGWAELAGAWALAIAWPIFQGASSGPDAFTMMRAGRLDLIAFTAIMVLLAPSVMLGIELLIGLYSRWLARLTQALLLGGLFGLVFWQAFSQPGQPAGARLLPLPFLAAILALLYMRSRFVRSMAGFMALATPVAVLAFWFTTPAASVMLPDPGPPENVAVKKPAPVVILVLDEFPLAAIESEPGRIDAANFPNFAGLARESTWYRNARAIGDVTTTSVPSLLTGQEPGSSETPPSFHNHPENLYSLLGAAGYGLNAAESITDLCPHRLCPRSGSRADRLAWIGLNGVKNSEPLPNDRAQVWGRRLHRYSNRANPAPRIQVDSFIESINGDTRRLSLLHLLLPHVPWIYLPGGQGYLSPIAPGVTPDPNGSDEIWTTEKPQVDASFQQMLLQTAYVDRKLGRLVGRLRQEGIWREALFVVTADHGGNFEAGGTRRYLTRKNAGWIMPVPLFIKYPGQTRGSPVDRTVLSLDLLPTILRALGSPPPDDLAGMPVSDRPPASGTIEAHSTATDGEIALSEDRVRRQFRRAVALRNRTFSGDSLHALAGHEDLLGRRLSRTPGLSPAEATFDPPWPEAPAGPVPSRLPAYVSGAVPAGTGSGPLALTLNGRVAGTLRSWEEGDLRRFAFTLPAELFRPGNNRVELFRITG